MVGKKLGPNKVRSESSTLELKLCSRIHTGYPRKIAANILLHSKLCLLGVALFLGIQGKYKTHTVACTTEDLFVAENHRIFLICVCFYTLMLSGNYEIFCHGDF
jgi:hypothetical protein